MTAAVAWIAAATTAADIATANTMGIATRRVYTSPAADGSRGCSRSPARDTQPLVPLADLTVGSSKLGATVPAALHGGRWCSSPSWPAARPGRPGAPQKEKSLAAWPPRSRRSCSPPATPRDRHVELAVGDASQRWSRALV